MASHLAVLKQGFHIIQPLMSAVLHTGNLACHNTSTCGHGSDLVGAVKEESSSGAAGHQLVPNTEHEEGAPYHEGATVATQK